MKREQTPPSMVEALGHAKAVAGGQSALGRIIGRRQSTVNYWLEQRLPLPAEHVLDVERETGVSRHLLRPDIYPLEPGEPFPSLPEIQAPARRVSCHRQELRHGAAA